MHLKPKVAVSLLLYFQGQLPKVFLHVIGVSDDGM